MSNATRWYTTREQIKAAIPIQGSDVNALIDSYNEAAAEDVEKALGLRFIPETAIKFFRWPQERGRYQTLDLVDQPVIAVTLIQAKAQDTTPTTIPAADYFLEPVNAGPPFTRIEIDRSSTSIFESGDDTPQRAIAVTGRWAYREDTEAAGTIAEELDATETGVDVSDSSLIGVGDTILIDSEAMFVSEKALLDTTANLNAALIADKSERTVAVTDGTLIKQGEIITVDSERMLVESISANNLTVTRGYDGSSLAAHDNATDIYAPRTLTATRGENGTTAATHTTGTAIARYAPPGDVFEYCRAYAIAHYKQGTSGWTGQIGGSEVGVETRMFGLWSMRQALIEKYRGVTL